ncbi:MAG: hypothetical protein WCF16_00405 [Alphaproteobacteria bacterium]
MSAPSEKDLARAKRVRERKLERFQAMVAACNCCWPIINYRNRHGHSDDCPYVTLWQKLHDDAQEVRDDGTAEEEAVTVRDGVRALRGESRKP